MLREKHCCRFGGLRILRTDLSPQRVGLSYGKRRVR